MSNIRLYLDEDAFQNALVKALRNSDVDIVTVSDVNKLSYSDEEQLIWAGEQGRVIYSYNMGDFSRLHRVFLAQGRTHGGIILVPQQRYSIGEQLRGLLRLIANKSAEEMMNHLVFLNAIYREIIVELVTLIACKTGLVKTLLGKGLAGLTRGLMYDERSLYL